MSSALSTACDSALPELAKLELHISASLVFDGQMMHYENFTAVHRWVKTAPREIKEYLLSSEYGLIKVALLSFCLIKNRVEEAENPFDFGVLEGYKPFAPEKFVASDKPRLIKAVREHRCLEQTDVLCMTLLQRAAARGDLELTKTLVLDLGASVDAYGVVPGLTPLWISCFSGYINIALFLVQQGAVSTCRDSISGRTILHFLNQFQTEKDIAQILAIGISAGLSLEEKDSHGNTPLMSTFIGWDFSHGIATKVLLELGVDALVRSNGDWTPMCAAVQSLDFETSRAIADSYLAYSLPSADRSRTRFVSIEDEKLTAFMTMCSQTEFYRRRVGGEQSFKKLQQIVELLLDVGTVDAIERSELIRGTNPLISASHMGHDDLVIAILSSTYCPGINEVDRMNRMSALHWSVEHGRFASTMSLLSQGANPLLRDKEGLNVFHRAARFSPKLLLQILESIDSTEFPKPEGHDTRSIIMMATSDGFTPFAIAVQEGSAEHLMAAETMRQKYHIDHDSYSLRKSRTETMKTLMAYLVECSVSSNIFTLGQVEYVLNISPRPKFKGDTSGDTLLHYAVGGWQYGKAYLNSCGDRDGSDSGDINSRNLQQSGRICCSSLTSSKISW